MGGDHDSPASSNHFDLRDLHYFDLLAVPTRSIRNMSDKPLFKLTLQQ
jgi:hypothetical protein